jgi:hypothetical protein
MDYQRPIKPNKNFYYTNFFKISKNSFLNQINDVCKDKEDPAVCIEKFSKSFDSVFNTLNDQLVEEDKIFYTLEKRMFDGDGLAKYKQIHCPSGWEGISS